MAILIKFILSSAGLSWILTKSIFFNSLRQRITRKHNSYKGAQDIQHLITREMMEGTPKPPIKKVVLKKIWWFIDEVMNCSGCLGFWAGILFYTEHTAFDFFQHGCIGAISAMILVRYSEKLRK